MSLGGSPSAEAWHWLAGHDPRAARTAAIEAATRVETDALVPDPSGATGANSIANGWPTATPGAPDKSDADAGDELVGAAVQSAEAPF